MDHAEEYNSEPLSEECLQAVIISERDWNNPDERRYRPVEDWST